MRDGFKLSAIILLFLLISATAFCRSGGITLESSVDNARITIGDPVQYTLKIKADAGVTYEQPHYGRNLGRFEIQDAKIGEIVKLEDGGTEQVVSFKIATYDEPDTYTIPPLEVLYTDRDGEEHTAGSESLQIVVESLADPEAQDIRDIKNVSIVQRNLTLLQKIVIGSAIGLVVLIIILLAVWKKLSGREYYEPVEPPRPADEVALESLAALAESDYITKGAWKIYYTELSDILRRYVEGRFNIPACEATTDMTDDMLEQTEDKYLTEDIRSDVMHILTESDLVKFAKAVPQKEDAEGLLPLAVRIIETTRQVIEEIQSGDGLQTAEEGIK